MNCRDCLHYEVCESISKRESLATLYWAEQCPCFKDKSRFAEVPCKRGDALFVLTSDSLTGIEETKCRNIKIVNLQDGVFAKVIAPCICDDWGGAYREFYIDDFGKTIFLTRKDAEKALEERKDK